MSLHRRQFGALALGASPFLAACSTRADAAYEDLAREVWRHAPVVRGEAAAVRRELVRCATLAPSSHNTQCWKFAIAPDAITIVPDFLRRCPAVDPDDHHLFVSLGCAAENLAQAGLAHGLHVDVAMEEATGTLRASLAPAPAQASPLFLAMADRQSTRGPYDGRLLAAGELRALEQAATVEGVQVILLTARTALEEVLEFVVAGNGAQLRDAAFVRELKAWIRFSARDAVRHRDGLYSASTGSPSVPAWLGRTLFDLVVTAHGENDKYARHVRSASGIAVFVGPSEDRAGWVKVGRACERFALQATALGIRTAHLNQPVEVAALRPAFARALGIPGRRPDLVLRFGRGAALPRSLRRAVEDVLV